jgi:hypothetical protein
LLLTLLFNLVALLCSQRALRSFSRRCVWAEVKRTVGKKYMVLDNKQGIIIAVVAAVVVADRFSANSKANVSVRSFYPLCSSPLPPRRTEWQVLAELHDHTGFANWTNNQDGWCTLEEHRDPSRCAGVTVESRKIAEIKLENSNLTGSESPRLSICLAATRGTGCR